MNSALLQLKSPLFCSTNHHSFCLQSPSRKKPSLLHLRLHQLGTAADASPETVGGASEEPPSIDFAFVSPRLLPDGTPDVQIRSASGGQKLRDIMLDGHIDLYGPYDALFSNCSGVGTCGTCLVEVVEGKELLSPRTHKEKEILKKVVIQQLPEWKAIEGAFGWAVADDKLLI